MLHCYIRDLIVATHQPPLTNHAEINRQLARLETVVTRTKQTPATQINRQLSGTLCSATHDSATTPHTPSNRHTPRLETAITRTKQTSALGSNRHFLHCFDLQVQQSQEFYRTRAVLEGQPSALDFQPSPLVSNRNNTSFKIAGNSLKINVDRNPNRNTNHELRVTPRYPLVGSENSDPFHSGNSEPSGNSRKG
jgi:hypothetical protein